MVRKSPPRITISKTPAEWRELIARIKMGGKTDINAYIYSSANKLAIMANENREIICILKGEKKKKQFIIPDDTYQVLEKMASDMNRPLAAIIDDFFLVPLMSHLK